MWREQWKIVTVGLVCAFVMTGLSLAIPLVIQRAIDHAIAPKSGHRAALWPYLAVVVVLAIVRFFVNFTRRYATARTGVRVEARMRELLYQAYLRYPRAFYDRHATGQVVSRATNDLYPIRYFIGWGMTQGIQSVMMIVGIAIVLFLVDVKLAALALVAMPFVAVLTFMFGRKVMPVSREVQQLKADVTEAADEAVVGIEMVQAFGREDDVQARFGVKAQAVRDGVLRQARIEAAFLPGLLFLPTLSIAAVVYFGGRDVINGALTYGQFFLFYQLLLQLVWPLEALGWILSLGQRATASASRSFAWLQGIETIPEPSQPTSLPAGPLGVRFEDVHFSYGSGSEVLSGIQLEVAPGEVIAVCGPTGAGKTSLLNLLPRFYDPTDGRVLVGGVDARDLPIEDLRNAVAIVTQKPILFSIPLRDNLTAARPDAPWDEVVAACEAAGVAHFASELPDGYDTLIGERGVNLSGGQRQRVALARALVAGARVVVLDDPMSAVDTQTERHLVENLRPALAGRTVLIATQRLSTVEVADRAVVVDDGVIVESGTPDELLARGGLFAQLFGEEVSAAA
ncbi:MAG: ABC-type multidrug transport system ATPase and permease component [Actinomycetia bacterium]|nr:ABC-type multidrug transport system ATPase and permease component [Actinomycetes bacterium]